ncbi:MAG: NAD kinase [Rhodocyclaceae bacterium]|nr:NAD kinase [Rhodocyclaceae bacterium]
MESNAHRREFRTIALIGKYQSRDVAEALSTLADFLRERGHTVLIEQGTAGATGTAGYQVASLDEIGSRADLAIVLGGDGTMLNTARRIAGHEVPLLGVNQGRLGFMTDIPRGHMLEKVVDVLEGRYEEEGRLMLDAEVLRCGERVFRNAALNDVVLNKGDLGRMIEFQVRVDGEYLYNLRSDGLIVCTPTGSTAYALSANGPILHPSVPGIGMVPLCPHALSNRPITVGDGCVIEITLVRPHDARVHCDGQARFDVHGGDILHITRSQHRVILLHPPGYSYFHMLREKLHWSDAPKKH